LWKGDAVTLLDVIDAETITPSDFTVTMKVRRGCWGCCRG